MGSPANFLSRLGRSPRTLNYRLGLVVIMALGFTSCGADSEAASFDGKRAFADIRTQCDFGPRIPGTEGHAACRRWIGEQIEALGLTLHERSFPAHLTMSGEDAVGWNLWGLPQSPAGGLDEADLAGPLIVISAHWDTRPWADKEPGPKKRPFLGANDGAGGVAVALEIARVLKGTPLADRVVLLFVDAEDSGVSNNDESWCLGSQFAAAHLPPWFDRVHVGINLDMVSGRGLKLGPEGFSREAAPDLVERLWGIGRDLAPRVFIPTPIGRYTDDHLPFIDAGVRYIDLLGAPYFKYWHRIGDTPANCDPAVMRRVGNVLIEFIDQEIRRLPR